MDRIYLCLAHMSGEEQKYIKEAFDTNWVVPLGPNVNAFEEELSSFVSRREFGYSCANDSSDDNASACASEIAATSQRKEVVALSAGTAAIHLGLIMLGVGKGDEVICQSFTFAASANPIVYQGATPVFVDSEPDTYNMDPDLLEEAIKDRMAKTGRKPKAIVAVYLYGMPAYIDKIMEVAAKYDIPVLEDAAEAMGSTYKGQQCGSFGAYGALSFNGNKMITTSGGGALVCSSPEDKNTIMWYATQAREAYPYYQHEAVGYNYRMSNICAGIGRGQMTVVDDHLAHHRHVQRMYEELLADVEGLSVHTAPSPEFDSNYWLCTLTLSPGLRIKGQANDYSSVVTGAVGGAAGVTHTGGKVRTDCQPNDNVEALRVYLDARQVESRPLWKPMHKQPVYKNAPAYVNGVSEELFHVGICLPAGPCVSDDDVRYICDCIHEAID